MRNSIFASLLFTSFLIVGCGGDDGTTPVTTDEDTGAAAADTGTSTDDTGTSTTDTATPDDTGMTTTETGGDTMMATDSPAADTAMDTPAMGATFTQVYAILSTKCGGCHTTSKPPSGGLDLSTKAKAYAELVGVKAESGACAGGGMTRVVAGNAANSLLLDKVEPAPTCGTRMPKDGTPLSDAQIATIRNWINAGAKND